MKKLIILFLLAGCVNDNPTEIPSNYYVVRTIDGCEYIEVVKSNCYSLTHKGNCKNPKHYFKDNNQYKYIIDLPEEYPLISTNPLYPDTLTGYISRDTLYIGFLNKLKK